MCLLLKNYKNKKSKKTPHEQGQGGVGKARKGIHRYKIQAIFQFCSTPQNKNPPFKLNFKKILLWFYTNILSSIHGDIMCGYLFIYIIDTVYKK